MEGAWEGLNSTVSFAAGILWNLGPEVGAERKGLTLVLLYSCLTITRGNDPTQTTNANAGYRAPAMKHMASVNGVPDGRDGSSYSFRK